MEIKECNPVHTTEGNNNYFPYSRFLTILMALTPTYPSRPASKFLHEIFSNQCKSMHFFIPKFYTSTVMGVKVFCHILSLDYCLIAVMYKMVFTK